MPTVVLVTRAFLTIALLAALAASGYVLTERVRADGFSKAFKSLGFGQSPRHAAEEDLLEAANKLDQARARDGTFRYANLTSFPDVRASFVNDSTYCLTAVKEGHAYHIVYGGIPENGTC